MRLYPLKCAYIYHAHFLIESSEKDNVRLLKIQSAATSNQSCANSMKKKECKERNEKNVNFGVIHVDVGSKRSSGIQK